MRGWHTTALSRVCQLIVIMLSILQGTPPNRKQSDNGKRRKAMQNNTIQISQEHQCAQQPKLTLHQMNTQSSCHATTFKNRETAPQTTPQQPSEPGDAPPPPNLSTPRRPQIRRRPTHPKQHPRGRAIRTQHLHTAPGPHPENRVRAGPQNQTDSSASSAPYAAALTVIST